MCKCPPSFSSNLTAERLLSSAAAISHNTFIDLKARRRAHGT